MSKLEFKEVELADKLIAAIQQRGTGGNLVKGLAELIKNSDDAYNRLQKKQIETTGIIEVGYWSMVKQKRQSINAFYIRDYGNGMSLENAKSAFGGGQKSYGADTSGDVRNGAIGVGGKDALHGMNEVYIVTTHNKTSTVIELRTNKNARIESKIHENIIDVKYIIDEINNILSPYCDQIDSSKDGTFAMFKLPTSRQGLRIDTLKAGLTSFYTLRNITSGKNKTSLKLINANTGEAKKIVYQEPESEIIKKPEPFQIAHVNKKGVQELYQVDVIIKRASDRRLEKDKETGENFIIENGKGGILDNYMFGYQNDPAAAKIFGTIIIHNWQNLFDEDPSILPENREGLMWSHRFNKEIEVRLNTFLKPILDTERRKLEPNAQADKELDKKMKSTLAFLNKLMKEDEFYGEKQVSAPPEVMEFSYGRMKIVPGKTKKVKLFINPNQIPTLTGISTVITEGEKSGVTIHPIGIIKTPDRYNYPPDVPYIEFEVTGNEQGTNSHLKAYYQNYETEVSISVVPETELYPTDGFAFVPVSTKLIKGKQKRLRLVIDTHQFKPGTIIDIESEDERVTLPYERITVSEPNMGKFLTEEFLYIECDESNIRTRILAKSKTTKDEERTAICKVRVTDKEESKVFFKDFKLDPAGDPRIRGKFNDGYVYIHTSNPVLQFYFGTNQEKIANKPTRDAVAMLADTILNIAFREWAKKRIEDGAVIILDETRRDEEIELEKGNLERQHGKQVHQTLAARYNTEKFN